MDDVPPGKRAALLRLLHLASPSLPTGAFAYSQGLEWAVERGWVADAAGLGEWLTDLIQNNMTRVDIPLLARMMRACREGRDTDLARWVRLLTAFRESSEARLEERNRGRAMVRLLDGLGVPMDSSIRAIAEESQLAGFALAAAHWRIPPAEAATGCVWSWLENQVVAGIKIIPLGQTEGHRLLLSMDKAVTAAVEEGLRMEDDDMGASSPALAIAASRHETQYTRLYRS